MECLDLHARFLWLSIDRGHSYAKLYIAICYFPPSYSTHVITSEGESSFIDLFPEISKFSAMGNVILLNDFQCLYRKYAMPSI
jgi:hypothetical protein